MVGQLQAYTDDLERSNTDLDEFAYIASHDLKEPLRGMHNHSRFLLEDYEKVLDEDGVRRLNRIVRLSQRMEKLVNDLLYFSRIGRQQLAIKRTDVHAIVKDVVVDDGPLSWKEQATGADRGAAAGGGVRRAAADGGLPQPDHQCRQIQ
jgi:light-regulated signal transduction histidine kinase (bacteriophytochrome)